MQDDNRGDSGRWLKGGPSPNPGGLSRRQRAVIRLLEGLTPKAAKTLAGLLDDPDPAIRLGAAKEIIGRVAPPPPRSPSVVVDVAVGADFSPAAHFAVLQARAAARKAERAAAVAEAEGAAVPVAATVVALSPPVAVRKRAANIA
jgi:hypothetical protein